MKNIDIDIDKQIYIDNKKLIFPTFYYDIKKKEYKTSLNYHHLILLGLGKTRFYPLFVTIL